MAEVEAKKPLETAPLHQKKKGAAGDPTAREQRSHKRGTCPGRAWQREPRHGGVPDRLDRGRAAGGERGAGFPPQGSCPPKDARRSLSRTSWGDPSTPNAL